MRNQKKNLPSSRSSDSGKTALRKTSELSLLGRFPKIRTHVSIPPSQVHESKNKPVSRAKIRRISKKEIKEGVQELN